MQSLQLAKLSSANAAFARDAVGTARLFDVQVGNEQFQLRCAAGYRSTATHWIQLSAGSASAWLSGAEFSRFAVLDEILGGTELSALPQDLQPAVLESAAESVLEALGQTTGSSWHVEAVVDEVPDGLQQLGISLSNSEGNAWRGSLIFDADLQPVLKQLVSSGRAETRFPTNDITIQAGLVIATVSLSPDELTSINTGDVIILDDGIDETTERRLEFAGQVAVEGTVQNDCLIVSAVSTISTGQPTTDDLEVRLSIESGRCELPVEHLATISAGDSLPLDEADLAQVSICVRGKPFATGELVKIGQRSGVRVISHVTTDGP